MFLLPAVLVALTACTNTDMVMPMHNGDAIMNAVQYIDYDEVDEREELKAYTGVDPVRTEWCAAFLNAVLEESGVPSLNTIDHEYPLLARSYLDWGEEVSVPLPGDIVVFPRGSQGWQGHVGIFIEAREVDGIVYFMILGGNQDNTVSIKPYYADWVLGIRRWK